MFHNTIKTANVGNALARGVAIGAPIAQQISQSRDRRMVNELAPQAMQGDRNALLQIATTNPGAAQAIQGMSQADAEAKQKGIEMLTRAARWADTPQKWEQAISWLGQQTGSDAFEAYRGRFNDRDIFLSQLEQESKGFTLSPGQSRYDAAGNVVATAPKGEGGPFEGTGLNAQVYNMLLTGDPNSREYAIAYWHATQPRLVQTEAGLMPVQPAPLPQGIQPPTNPIDLGGTGQQAGTGTAQPGGVIPGTAKPLTGEEAKAAGFVSRMEQAESEIKDILGTGYRPGNVQDAVLGETPLVGNFMVSEEGQRYRQAQENWVTANLRKESGAVIGAEEMEQEIRKYFPQPGDSQATIEQKRRARAGAAEAVKKAAGRGYTPSASKVTRENIQATIEKHGLDPNVAIDRIAQKFNMTPEEVRRIYEGN